MAMHDRFCSLPVCASLSLACLAGLSLFSELFKPALLPLDRIHAAVRKELVHSSLTRIRTEHSVIALLSDSRVGAPINLF
jgi:hypothetical protein